MRTAGAGHNQRSAATGCALWGCLTPIVAVVVLVILLLTSAISIGPCTFDLNLGPGKGRHSKHLAVKATPASGVQPDQVVRVTSTAFGVEQTVGVAMCLREADTKRRGVDACDTVHGSRYRTDARARLDVPYPVPRVITVGSRPYDCASRPGRCLLVAANAGDYNESGGEAVRFRTGLPVADLVASTKRRVSNDLPVLTHPTGPLRPLQRFVADATGFQPGEPVVAAWCKRSILSGNGSLESLDSGCITSEEVRLFLGFGDVPPRAVRADGFGHVRLSSRARADVQALRCDQRPGACLYVIAAAVDTQRSALVPITIAT